MRLKLISCEIFCREMCQAIARSPHTIDVEFLPKGLHDIGQAGMSQRLQEAVDRVQPDTYQAILMGYALCNNGVVGLAARHTPLVIPRGHDCITLFLGSRQRYHDYFHAHPGTYFLTSGWLERGHDVSDLRQLSIQHQTGMDQSYEQLVAKYGEDNAKYLWEQLGNTLKNYGRFAYIAMGVEPDDRFERQARQEAQQRGWEYEQLEGRMTLLDQLLRGDWNDADFLAVAPGELVAASYDDTIIAARPAAPPQSAG